jgi:hypothetical protein
MHTHTQKHTYTHIISEVIALLKYIDTLSSHMWQIGKIQYNIINSSSHIILYL